MDSAPGTGFALLNGGHRGAVVAAVPVRTAHSVEEFTMTTSERSPVVGVFRDRTHAEQAVDELRRLGFRDEQIGVAARSGDHAAAVAEGEDTKWAAGATAGAVAGGATGTLL